MNNTEKVMLGAFTAVEAAHAYSAFNPSIFTIRRFPDEYTKRDIRAGCALASGFAIVLGIIVSKVVDSVIPLVFAIFTIVFMCLVYEYFLSKAEEDAKRG